MSKVKYTPYKGFIESAKDYFNNKHAQIKKDWQKEVKAHANRLRNLVDNRE